MKMRPSWVEISQSKLVENYRRLSDLVGPDIELLSVVKADAYGHGVSHCAPALAQAGSKWMGVTCIEEGIALRAICPEPRILIISGLWFGQAEEALAKHLTPVVWENFHLEELEKAAQAKGLPPQSVAVHVEIDTGMSRQGLSLEGSLLEDFLEKLSGQKHLRLEGVMTHFSSAEELRSGETEAQASRLEEAVRRIEKAGFRPEYLHAGASATVTGGNSLPALKALASSLQAKLMIRPGLALYGYVPRFEPNQPKPLHPSKHSIQPVLEWKTRVMSLRTIPAGATSGYNRTYTAKQPTVVATIPLGYADGLNRSLSNRFSLLVGGKKAPIIGRISMDHCMLDVTEIPHVQLGDEVVVLGRQGEEVISAYDHADVLGTIPWEILCDIGPRVHRLSVE